MPTPLDRAMQSRNAFLAFAGIVTAVSAWSIWGGEMFPAEKDPVGDPSKWTDTELKRWLDLVSALFHVQALFAAFSLQMLMLLVFKRALLPDGKATREDLLERVRANMRPPPRG